MQTAHRSIWPVRARRARGDRRPGLRTRARILAILALAGVASLVQPGRDALADILPHGVLPHRAVYVLSSGAKGLAGGVDGLMTFEIKDACDGWTMDLKAELTMTGGEGEALDFGWSQSTWEAKDGSRYRYFYKEHTGGKETVRRRGEARLDLKTGLGLVVTDLPDRGEAELEKGTLFPVRHSVELVARAAAGETYFLARIFDGSVGDAAIEVGAAIGKGMVDENEDSARFPALRGVKSFPVSLAYYIWASPEGLPDNEQNLRFYENTVVSMLTFSLGDVEVVARLDRLEALTPEKC